MSRPETTSPPTRASPQLMGLYAQVRNLGALPNPGGLLDQRPDHYAAFAVFASAEAEHQRSQE